MSENQLVVTECTTPEECQRKAQQLAADTYREPLQVRVFRQGPRRMFSTVMPIRVLERLLKTNNAEPSSPISVAIQKTNRPIIKEHVRAIENYLRKALEDDSPYILPPLTLNATGRLDLFAIGGSSPSTGWAVLPEEQLLFITDGQHRFRAIQELVAKLRGTELGATFLNDGIPVMVTLSSDSDQVHQDFADASKTKPLPPSLVATYDLRHPGNRAVMRISREARVLKDRVDATSSTLSKMSPFLFLANQVRQFVKTSLSNRATLGDTAFYELAENALSNAESFDRWVSSRVLYLDILTEIIPDWKVIAGLPAPRGPQGDVVLSKMKDLRNVGSVALSAAGLNVLGLVSYSVLTPMMDKGRAPDPAALLRKLQPLQGVDWNREAPIWQGNIVQDGRIKTQTPNIKAAATALITRLSV